MKLFKNITRYSALTLCAFTLNACFDDPGTDVVLKETFVSFVEVSKQINEKELKGSLGIDLSYAQTSPVQVSYKIEEIGAVGGIDYKITSPNPITIPAGAYSVPLEITVTDNNVYEAEARQVKITITGVTGADGITVAGNTSSTITILNDDCPSNTSIWYGSLYCLDDEGADGIYDGGGTGAANVAGDCNILVINSSVFGAAGVYTLYFTPTEPGATSGTVSLPKQKAFTSTSANLNGYQIEGTGGGIYDESTKTIEITYTFYNNGAVVWAGVWTITPDN